VARHAEALRRGRRGFLGGRPRLRRHRGPRSPRRSIVCRSAGALRGRRQRARRPVSVVHAPGLRGRSPRSPAMNNQTPPPTLKKLAWLGDTIPAAPTVRRQFPADCLGLVSQDEARQAVAALGPQRTKTTPDDGRRWKVSSQVRGRFRHSAGGHHPRGTRCRSRARSPQAVLEGAGKRRKHALRGCRTNQRG
jgi:hypothetical protein